MFSKSLVLLFVLSSVFHAQCRPGVLEGDENLPDLDTLRSIFSNSTFTSYLQQLLALFGNQGQGQGQGQDQSSASVLQSQQSSSQSNSQQASVISQASEVVEQIAANQAASVSQSGDITIDSESTDGSELFPEELLRDSRDVQIGDSTMLNSNSMTSAQQSLNVASQSQSSVQSSSKQVTQSALLGQSAVEQNALANPVSNQVAQIVYGKAGGQQAENMLVQNSASQLSQQQLIDNLRRELAMAQQKVTQNTVAQQTESKVTESSQKQFSESKSEESSNSMLSQSQANVASQLAQQQSIEKLRNELALAQQHTAQSTVEQKTESKVTETKEKQFSESKSEEYSASQIAQQQLMENLRKELALAQQKSTQSAVQQKVTASKEKQFSESASHTQSEQYASSQISQQQSIENLRRELALAQQKVNQNTFEQGKNTQTIEYATQQKLIENLRKQLEMAQQKVSQQTAGSYVTGAGTVGHLYNSEDERIQALNAQYHFSTLVDDNINGNLQMRTETRQGGKVEGNYSYDDGNIWRTVFYEADDKGFRIIKEEILPSVKAATPLDGHASVQTRINGDALDYTITSADINGRH